MAYHGRCACGWIEFVVDSEPVTVVACHCGVCRRHDALLWFMPRSELKLGRDEADLVAYAYNLSGARYHFCPRCSTMVFSLVTNKQGTTLAAANVRCIGELDAGRLRVLSLGGGQRVA